MWQEYLIPSAPQKQTEIIRALRKWITELENSKLISGFAFSHYYNNPPERDELRIRFEYVEEGNANFVESELETNVRKFINDYVIEKRVWGEGTASENISRAFEFGSRCAFLLWELIEKGRFQENWISNFYPFSDQSVGAFNFQISANAGLMNSLGISKVPNELLIHIFNLVTVTKSHNLEELIGWFEQCQGVFSSFFDCVQ